MHLCPSNIKLNYANNIHCNVLGSVQRQQLKTCQEVLNTSINTVQSGAKVQTFLRNLMSVYLEFNSSETLRFYKTIRGQIPIKLSLYRPRQALRFANG